MAETSKATISELRQHAREIGEDTRALKSAIDSTVTELEELAHDLVAERPYMALLAAGGVGYILGGGLPTALTRTLIMFASRLAVEMATLQVGARMQSPVAQRTPVV
jgi:hypothetical protein